MLLMMFGSLVVAVIFMLGKFNGYGDWFTFGVGCAALVLCISLCIINRHWFTFG